MTQPVEIKSDFNTLKLVATWAVILLLSITPWLIAWFEFDKALVIFGIATNMLAVAAIIYVKVSLKVIIHPQEQVIEYYWMGLLGRKHQVTINIKEAEIKWGIIKYRGNDLWNLIIVDNKDRDNKIALTEITDGFDERQMRDMYRVLKQVSTD
ncbi:MAG: hypothetical protein ACXVAY_00450 [Mucilaginibacter sp.]